MQHKSINTEKNIIGLVINNPELIGQVPELKPEHFYNSEYKLIFSKILELMNRGKNVDIILLTEALKGLVEPYFIAELSEHNIGKGLIKDHVNIVVEHAEKRQLSVALRNAETKLDDNSSQEVINSLIATFDTIQNTENNPGFQAISDFSDAFYSDLETVFDKKEPTGLKTGFIDLDNLTGGLKKKNLFVIGAQSSMGKTALAIQIALYIAKKNKPVGLISLEMAGKEIFSRIAFLEKGIDGGIMNSGNISQYQFNQILEVVPEIQELPIFIDETLSGKAPEVISKSIFLQKTKGIQLLIIDYLQLMAGPGETRNLEIGKISRQMKILARNLNIPVILLSQLSRKCEGRMPNLSDLRDSGSIEQDADQVLFIYRPGKNDPEVNDNKALLRLAKNRHGATGQFKLTFIPEYAGFYNYHPEQITKF